MNIKPSVGIIGVGKMGDPMTRHLIRKGYMVYVSDLDQEKVQPLVSIGAREAATAIEMANETDVQIIMVGFDPEIKEIVLGEKGLLQREKGDLRL